MNKLDMVVRVLEDNTGLLPIDVATALMNEGYDISSLTDSLDGFTLDDFVNKYEELYG